MFSSVKAGVHFSLEELNYITFEKKPIGNILTISYGENKKATIHFDEIFWGYLLADISKEQHLIVFGKNNTIVNMKRIIFIVTYKDKLNLTFSGGEYKEFHSEKAPDASAEISQYMINNNMKKKTETELRLFAIERLLRELLSAVEFAPGGVEAQKAADHFKTEGDAAKDATKSEKINTL